MKRRDFMKALGILGTSLVVPPVLTKKGFISPLRAAGFSDLEIRNARAAVVDQVDWVSPSTLPTVINVFMYGGPSELAGNLTNIADINANSQNSYPADMLRTADNNNGQITANGFWRAAGGSIMEELIAAKKMSIYRTINRVVDDSKAHRTSIWSAQLGGLNETAPGMGTTLAAILYAHIYKDETNPPLLPFVSFEGESVLYNAGDITLDLPYRPISFDGNFRNPYSRRTGILPTTSTCNGTDCSQVVDQLARNVSLAHAEKYQKIIDAFDKRKELDDFISTQIGTDASTKVPTDVDANGNLLVQYTNDSFGRNMRSAMVLAIANSDTRFIAVSTGGLGGWDNHDNAIAGYSTRVQNLMLNMKAAANHMDLASRSDIIINVYGEFGRNVNLNGSMGWDHGNNMNLYTFGGSGVGGRQLGKIVGKTKRIGTSGQNRQFTAPTDDSYQCEPMGIASSVYKYFGVQNPEILSANEDMRAPNGFVAIDENAPNEWKA